MMKLIIINGLPATGKTHLARSISQKLSVPAIGKDDIKEFLFDTLGSEDPADAKNFVQISINFLYEVATMMLSTGHSIIIENAFEVQFAKSDIQRIIDTYSPNVYEIYCHTDSATRRHRFIKRNEDGKRHRGHFDSPIYDADDESERIVRHAPLHLGKTIMVDTTDFEKINVADIANFLT